MDDATLKINRCPACSKAGDALVAESVLIEAPADHVMVECANCGPVARFTLPCTVHSGQTVTLPPGEWICN